MVSTALPDYNILLLGETGSGKSLIINSLANYIKYETLDEAESEDSDVVRLIPCRFTICDDSYDACEIIEGTDHNECLSEKTSGTIALKTYLFNLPHCNVRIIDSAGVGTGKGVDMDAKNIDDVLDFISHYDTLHVIAFVINNNQVKLTDSFKFCFKHLMTHLDQSAANNVVFLMTFSEGCAYKPGNVIQPLKLMLNELKQIRNVDGKDANDGVDIRLTKNILYCIDNKGFQYLLARRNGLQFNDEEIESYKKAWSRSTYECNRLLQYIIGHDDVPPLKPYRIKDHLSIRDAKKAIKILNPFIKEVIKVIEANIESLQHVYDVIIQCRTDVELEQKLLVILQIAIDVVEIDIPQTICISEKCTSDFKEKHGGDFETNYPNMCCTGCTMASPYKRLFCQSIELLSGHCKKCGCHANDHLVLYYLKVAVEKEFFKMEPVDLTDVYPTQEQLNEIIHNVEKRMKQLEKEKHIIKSAILVFNKFMEIHATVHPTNAKAVKFVTHVDQLCSNEEKIEQLTKLPDEVWEIDNEQIFDLQNKLFYMKINGEQIKKVYDIQIKAKERAVKVADIITLASSGLAHKWYWLTNKVHSITGSTDDDSLFESFANQSLKARDS
ncbi:hypothetical protein CHUAL_012449 [Chamberlinius hualienensis]